jgi:hydrogenase 3 maturation protease
MSKKLVLTVGNSMMGDDAAGSLLARMLEQAPLPAWDVLDGGSAPENALFRVRELGPEEVLVIDAADMDLEPGEVRLISAERLEDPFLMTTHTLPLSYLVESLKEFVPRVALLGIQPRLVSFGYPPSAEVKAAVARVYESLKQGSPAWDDLPAAGDA